MAKINHEFNTSILTLNKRLTDLMKRNAMTITKLSSKAGIAIGTIQKLMTDSNCNPTIGSLEAICKVLNVTISELIAEDQKTSVDFDDSVLLLNWEEISSDAERWLFRLKINDDSMLPVFHKGCILTFDPKKVPYHNSFILVKLHDHDRATFKQMITDKPYQYIKEINPLLKDNLTKLEPQDKVVATLVEAKMHY